MSFLGGLIFSGLYNNYRAKSFFTLNKAALKMLQSLSFQLVERKKSLMSDIRGRASFHIGTTRL